MRHSISKSGKKGIDRKISDVNRNLGLVLAGGGAKGAYEVGTLKSMVRFGISPGVIAGTSIGALNGAALASCQTFREGVELCESIWTTRDIDPKINPEISPIHIFSTGQWKKLFFQISKRYASLMPSKLEHVYSFLPGVSVFEGDDDRGIFDQSAVKILIQECIDFDFLLSDAAPDFYVSVYPGFKGKEGMIIDLARYSISQGKSRFFLLKKFSKKEAVEILLASAALPMGFTSVRIDGKTYRDGGMGGCVSCQGNVPATPLVNAGCTHAIVCHLDQKALWNRYDFPTMTTIEIRPSTDLGGIREMLDFDPARIQSLMMLGEADADQILEKTFSAIFSVQEMRDSRKDMEKVVNALNRNQKEYDDVIKEF